MGMNNKWVSVLPIISVICIITGAALFVYAIFNAEVDNQLFMSIVFIFVGFGYLSHSLVMLKVPASKKTKFKPSWYYINMALAGVLIVGSVIRIVYILM